MANTNYNATSTDDAVTACQEELSEIARQNRDWETGYNLTPADMLTAFEVDTGATAVMQPGQRVQVANPANFRRPAFDHEKVLPVFRERLIEIFKFGTNLNDTANEYQGKIQEKAISGLAKILEVRRSYFDDATPEVSKVLLDELYEQCKAKGLKGRTIQTTEFHLLSRLLRQSDRKQASADAKVLIRAHNEKQTEKTFADWVKNLRGLTKIRMEIDNFGRAEQTEKDEQQRSKNKHKGNLKTLFDTALAASWMPLTSFSFENSPEELRELIPSEGTWLPIAIARRNGKVTFYIPKKDSCPTELHPDLVEYTDVGERSGINDSDSNQALDVP